MGVPHPIPYQGSKRGLARTIISYFPQDPARLVEPFAGSAAVSLAATYYARANRFFLNDLNQALMALWNEIINRPASIAEAYAALWKAQVGHERAYYDLVRAQFNQTQRPDYLLYLLARCVKASVRYNTDGEFNQSPDNRRKGAHPNTMRQNIFGKSLPKSLHLTHLEIDAGRSSQATLLGRVASTVESLYLSPALVARIGQVSTPKSKHHSYQHSLFEATL